MTPPIPRPAMVRSQNSSVRLVEYAAAKVKMPKKTLQAISAVLRP